MKDQPIKNTPLENRVCVWKGIIQKRGSTMINPNERLMLCKDRCDGYGRIDGSYNCQTYYLLQMRKKE